MTVAIFSENMRNAALMERRYNAMSRPRTGCLIR